MSNFGKNLGIIQNLRGISNSNLAKKMEVSQMTISGHRTGRSQPNLKMLRKYAEALGVRASILIDENLADKLKLSIGE